MSGEPALGPRAVDSAVRKVAADGQTSIGHIQHHFAGREELLRFSCRAVVEDATDQRGADADPRVRLSARVWTACLAHAVVDPAIAEIVVGAQVLPCHRCASSTTSTRPDVRTPAPAARSGWRGAHRGGDLLPGSGALR